MWPSLPFFSASLGGFQPQIAPGMSGLYTAMTIAESLAGLAGGLAGMRSASTEASQIEEQARLTESETRAEALRRAREISRFQSSQAHSYAASGFTLEGSPALVLDETRRLGQQEVDALVKSGQAKANLLRQRSAIAKSAGRGSFLQAILGVGTNATSRYLMGRRVGLYGQAKSPLATGGGIDGTLPDIIK